MLRFLNFMHSGQSRNQAPDRWRSLSSTCMMPDVIMKRALIVSVCVCVHAEIDHTLACCCQSSGRMLP